jgi:glycosyltransferase involved in cell wall biosynthesis
MTEFDPARFNSQSDREEYRVGTAASLTPRKGIKYLIDAFPAILREYSNAELLIAGEPPEGNKRYATQLKQRVQMHGIEKQVEFLGWVDNMPKYLSKIDIFVLPSLNEGIPGVVREALAMRTPVVATDVGGTSEAVIDDKTGFLINDEDTEQISEKVLQLLDDESKRIALGRQGRRHVIDEFSIDYYVQKYENFLKSAEN